MRGVWLSGLYRLFKSAPPADPLEPPAAEEQPAAIPSRIGPYAIARKLGAGGMGVVYEAHDERLQRSVALKMMLGLGQDELSRSRFWREARAAASVNHPNVCQIYEIGEDRGQLFIAMELLDGEPLTVLMARGPLGVEQAVPIALDVLAALQAIHSRGIVHRDLKPSNVFVTAHAAKLLDFGLARPEQLGRTLEASLALTRSGVVLGTPRYMAPEQVNGEPIDARADLFAVGAMLFEMLAGRPAFAGESMVEVLRATLMEQPPALTGSPAIAAVDRVIRRALAKSPAGRPASAQAMADELNAVRGVNGRSSQQTHALAQPLTRVVVLPFRVLRPDPEIDFLAYSLPDAITTSLAGIGSLVVRSSATAARFAGEAADIKALAAEADVDRVVMGTLLRAGDQLRASTQLIEAPGGTVLASHTVQSTLGDLFRLQDDIARRVVDGLALPRAGRPSPSPSPDAPRDPNAYERYLRGNELARTYEGMIGARALYEQTLELDPNFAPAWAHLGRCHRVIGKYIEPTPDSDGRAEDAFIRAIALNPRLSVAHKFYANLEADTGRAREAIIRLLGEAGRHGNDPELFAGLVHACRYAGLLDESVAAHEEARRLDPNIVTSVQQTLLMKRDIDRLVGLDVRERLPGADDGIRVIALGMSDRRDEARQLLEGMRQRPRIQTFEVWTAHLGAWLDRRVDLMLSTLTTMTPLKIFDDPEAIFQEGWMFCDLGEHGRGLEYMQRAIGRGYFAAPTLGAWPQFDALREVGAFQAMLATADAGRQRALAAFRETAGELLVGR
ncbi:MAG TPA: protein kinase [Vicinamibacterales bacterium]|jgi:serine/threonine protein kinase/tetratricopeptide (TPR) repeat protein